MGGTCISATSPRPQQLEKSISVVESGLEEVGLTSSPAVDPGPDGAACLESVRLLEASPVGSPPSPRDLPEPRLTSEHTNNRIGESAAYGVLLWAQRRALGRWAWTLGPSRTGDPGAGGGGQEGARVGSAAGLASRSSFWGGR